MLEKVLLKIHNVRNMSEDKRVTLGCLVMPICLFTFLMAGGYIGDLLRPPDVEPLHMGDAWAMYPLGGLLIGWIVGASIICGIIDP